MEILLIACMLAYAAGTQSEQSKLGLSPAQRDILREEARHEKAVQKIANKHGGAPLDSPAQNTRLRKEMPAADGTPVLTLPEAFGLGYRSYSPVERVATPMGRRAGGWAARGVAWAEDTGKGALREYRRRRQARGHDDPAPVLEPIPPMPTQPPTAGVDSGKGKVVSLKKRGPEPAAGAPTSVVAQPEPATAPKEATEPSEPTEPKAAAAAGEPAAPETTEAQPAQDTEPAAAGGGVGRMAAEVTYESVMDESDELTLMCDDDVNVYGRIGKRCEREIGRGDSLIAAMEIVGFGPKVIGWVARGKEQYQVINSQLDDLKSNTVAQGEAVVKAKALLEAGQGVYADIAKDMESVADRDVYISDAVDSEDTSAHTETYETKGA